MRLTGEIMKIITCFKLVPEEQDIVVTPQHSLNFDRADAKISQFDLNAIEAAAQLSAEGDEIVALTVGGSLLQNSKVRKDVLSRAWTRQFVHGAGSTAGAFIAPRHRSGAGLRGQKYEFRPDAVRRRIGGYLCPTGWLTGWRTVATPGD